MICPHEPCTCEVESGHCSDACESMPDNPFETHPCACDHDACDANPT